jgi:hypothetical protein
MTIGVPAGRAPVLCVPVDAAADTELDDEDVADVLLFELAPHAARVTAANAVPNAMSMCLVVVGRCDRADVVISIP